VSAPAVPVSPGGANSGGKLPLERDLAFEMADHATVLATAAKVAGLGLLVAGAASLVALRPEVFAWGVAQLPPLWGLGSVVLLVSSGLTVAWAAHCARLRRHRIALGMLVATLVLSVAFLGSLYGQTLWLLERGLGWGEAFLPVGAVTGEPGTGREAGAGVHEAGAPSGDATTTPLAPFGPRGLRDPVGEGGTVATDPVPRHGRLFFGVLHVGNLVLATWVLVGLVAVLVILGRIRVRGLDVQRVMILEALARLWQPAVAFGILVFALLHLKG